jgi:ornithine cyclodeaminase/alanine dehydrogenase-like protein (mu-crystallin family)
MTNNSLYCATDLPDFLAPSAEMGVCWTEQQVHELLVKDPKGYISFLDHAFCDMATETMYAEFTPKQILNDRYGNGDFRTMPCITERNGETCKTIKIVGTNLAQKKVPGQITVGKAYVLDSIENFITHSVDACLLSSARTGACAALGVRKLSTAAEVAIVGCGRVGFYTALYLLASLPLRRLYLADSDPLKAKQLYEYFRDIAPATSIVMSSIDEALATPVVIMATTSRHAIASPENTSAELIISLGADADDQSELAAAWADASDLDIVVDTHDCERFGDIKAWNKAGKLTGRRISDLLSLYRGEQMRSSRSLFVSTGSALFDNLTLRYMLGLDATLFS